MTTAPDPPEPPHPLRAEPVPPPVRWNLPYGGRPQRPWWVKLSLWGLGKGRQARTMAIVFVWICLALAAACPIVGHRLAPSWGVFYAFFGWVGGIASVGAAASYWAAYRWVDRHDVWE